MIIKIEPSLDNEPYFALINSEFASKYSLHPGQLVEITPYNVGMKIRPSETYPQTL